MATLSGSCHCGQLRIALHTELAPEAITPRSCQCTFCRRHGSLSVSDPAGRIVITIGEPAATSRYRFGMKTADFIACARCGVYVAAVTEDAGVVLAVVNALALDVRARFTTPPQPMDYDGEDAATRLQRRRTRWTPAGIE